jgi:hypothetical protein
VPQKLWAEVPKKPTSIVVPEERTGGPAGMSELPEDVQARRSSEPAHENVPGLPSSVVNLTQQQALSLVQAKQKKEGSGPGRKKAGGEKKAAAAKKVSVRLWCSILSAL